MVLVVWNKTQVPYVNALPMDAIADTVRQTDDSARRARESVNRAVAGAVAALQRSVTSHEAAHGGHIARLRDALAELEKERETQVAAFRDAYRGMRSAARAVLRRIDEHDRRHDALVASFLEAVASIPPIELDLEKH